MKKGTAVYSVTLSILASYANEWLEWMKTEHIPDTLKTGHFLTENDNEPPKIFEIVTGEEEVKKRYEVRYFALSVEEIKAYREGPGQEIGGKYKDKYGGVTSDVIRTTSTLVEKITA